MNCNKEGSLRVCWFSSNPVRSALLIWETKVCLRNRRAQAKSYRWLKWVWAAISHSLLNVIISQTKLRQAASTTLFSGHRRSTSQSRSRAITTRLRKHQSKERASRGLRSKLMANNPLRIFTIRRSFRVSTSPRMPRQHSMLAAGSRVRRSRWWHSRCMRRGFQWAASKPIFFQTINWCLTRAGPTRSILQ